jgi:hypothetical protein
LAKLPLIVPLINFRQPQPFKKIKMNPATKVIDTSANIAENTLPFIIKTIFVLGVGYLVYSRYTNRFIKLKEKSNYPAANVSEAQAKGRAAAIGGSITLFGNSFETVSENLSGLNYNGFVRVYNAFGHQTGTFLSGDLDLIEWLRNQFTDYQMQQLSFLLNGAFFKNQKSDSINPAETQEIINLLLN